MNRDNRMIGIPLAGFGEIEDTVHNDRVRTNDWATCLYDEREGGAGERDRCAGVCAEL